MKTLALVNPLIYLGGLAFHLIGMNLGLFIVHFSVFLSFAYTLNELVKRSNKSFLLEIDELIG